MIHYINRLEEKNHIILIDTQNVFEKIKHLSMIKKIIKLSELGIEGNLKFLRDR